MDTVKSCELNNIYGMMMQAILFNDIQLMFVDAVEIRRNASMTFGRHMHLCYEYIHVQKGLLITFVNNLVLPTSSGNAVIIPAGVKHSHYMEGEDSCCYSFRFVLEKRPRHQNERFDECFDSISACLSTVAADFPSKILSMLDELTTVPVFARQTLLMKWLFCLAQNKREARAPQSQPVKRSDDIVSNVDQFLCRFYMNDISVIDIAKSLNFSYRHLARIYKANTGLTFTEKLTELRIENAKNKLLSSGKPIKQIAHECGFANEYYFSTIFRKATQMTPTNYRSMNQAVKARAIN